MLPPTTFVSAISVPRIQPKKYHIAAPQREETKTPAGFYPPNAFKNHGF
jgi:hypothetical protein